MNTLEKIFSLIIRIGGDKQLQSLYDRLKNILGVIREIGNEDGLKKVAEGLKVYDTVIKDADKSRKALVETGQKEKAVNEAAAKVMSFLGNECKNLIFTKREIATIQRNYIALADSEKRSVEELQAQVNILNIAWKKMGQEQRNSSDGKKVTADLKSMREEIRQLTMAAGDNSRNIGNYVSGLYNAVTSQIAIITTAVYTVKRVLSGIFKPFQDLEYRMSMVKAVTQATETEFIALEQNARDLGATTEYTATEVAELQLAYGRMGFVPDQIIKITGATLDLATATGENLAKSADVVGTTLKGFNLEAGQTQRVVDVMTQAFNASSLQLDSFYEAMKYVAPIASVANVSLEQTSAMLGVLADRGIRGSQAGTALRRIFTEMAKEGGSVSERLDQLSKKGLTLGGAMDEVGRYAMTAFTVLSKSKDSVDEMTVALDNSAGAAKKAADIMRDNMKGDGDKFLSAVKEKLIAIGEYLSPLARWIIQVGTTAVTNLKSVIGVIATYVITIKTATVARIAWNIITKQASIYETAFGKALMVNMVQLKEASAMAKLLASAKLLLTGQIKAAATAFGMFTKTLMKNPFGLIAVGLASVISYFAFFRKESESTSQAYSDCADNINKEKAAIDELKSALDNSEDGSVKRRDLINEINEKYKEYLPQLLTEKSSYDEIKTALDSVNQKLEENIRLKYASKIAEEEAGRISEAEALLVDKLKEKWQDAHKNRQMSVETELEIIEAARALSEANQQFIIDSETGLVGYTAQMRKMKADAIRDFNSFVEGIGVSSIKFAKSTGIMMASVYKSAVRLGQANNVTESDQTTPGTTPAPVTGGAPKEKGEWSLSKDKAHNDALLKLKEQLYRGEIASDEAYNKQALQLEIETLTKRIALNTDGNKVLVKLRNELADKQYQLQKTEKKEAETTTADEQASAALRLKYENDHIDAGIAALKDGVDKRIQLNDQATNKALQGAGQSYKAEIKSLNGKQEAHREDSAEYQSIEQEKARLASLYAQKRTDIGAAGADARVKILRDATEEELKEYAKVPGMAADVERQITENKRREVDERLKLARKETEQAVSRAGNQYAANEAQADVTIGNSGRKRNVARLQNEIQLHRDQAQAYQTELNAILSGGDAAIQEHKARYDELIRLIGQEQNTAMNLGKGKTSGGERKSIWKQFTEMSDDEVNQLKQQAFDLAAQIGDAMIQAQQQTSQRRLNNEKKAIEAQYKVESKLLDSKRDKGLISEKTYQKELEKLEAQKAAKEEQAEREAFEREKKLNIAQAWMNVAVGIAKIWAEWGTTPFTIPVAVAQTAILTAQGVIQTGFIAAQKFAQGGIIPIGDKMGVVKGRSHAQGGNTLYIDGRPIGEIEHDELIAIVNKHDTRRIGALSEANSVHGRKFASGGLMFPNGFMENHVAPPVSLSQLDAQLRAQAMQVQATQQNEAINAMREDTRQQIEAINQRIDTLKVVVVESDITEAQNKIKKLKVKTSW